MSKFWCDAGSPTLQTQTFSQFVPGGSAATLLTPLVLPGYYWWIPYIAFWTDDSAADNLFLAIQDCTGGQFNAYPTASPLIPTAGAGLLPNPDGMILIYPLSQDASIGSVAQLCTSLNYAMIAPLPPGNRLIVPSNFRLVVGQLLNTNADNKNWFLRMSFINIKNGNPPPIY